MRIVLDTNVIVSGMLTPSGTAARVLLLARQRALTIVYDQRIMVEYGEVLSRLPLREAMLGDTDALLAFLDAEGELIVDPPAAAFALPDPKDQCFLDVALAAGVEAIVTRNHRDFPDDCGVLRLSPAQVVRGFER